jgi:ABC-type branched-subunit amino acid transport system substrate-binding protein
LVVAAACASVVAACGETSREENSGTGAKGSSSAVTIGLIVPTDTPTTNQPGAVGGTKAAIEAVNAKGGINGHKVEYLYCNDKGDPNESTKCAREMATKKVLAVVGGSALNDKLIAPILEKANIPMVGWDAYFTYGSPNAYLYSGGNFFSNQWSSAYGIRKGYKMSLVSSDNATGAGLREILDDVAKRSGGAFVNTVLVPPNAPDFGTYVAAARKGGANAVMVFLGLQQGAQFIQAAEQANAPFKAYFKSAPDPTFLKTIGDASGKLFSPSTFPPANSEALATFRTEMEAAASGGEKFAAPEYYNEAAISPWLAVHTIANVLKDAPEVTSGALRTTLDGAKDIDMGGIIPPWTPSAPGPSDAFSRVSNSSLYLVSFAGGTPKIEIEPPVPLEDAIAGQGI